MYLLLKFIQHHPECFYRDIKPYGTLVPDIQFHHHDTREIVPNLTKLKETGLISAIRLNKSQPYMYTLSPQGEKYINQYEEVLAKVTNRV